MSELSNVEMIQDKLSSIIDEAKLLRLLLDNPDKVNTNAMFVTHKKIRSLCNEADSYVMGVNRERNESEKKISQAIAEAKKRREKEEAEKLAAEAEALKPRFSFDE